MLGKHKLLFIIPAILLIPILLGMTPLNMAHRLASGGPFTHCKHVKLNNHCPFNSLASHNDLTVGILNSTPLNQESLPSQEVRFGVPDPFHSNITFNSLPLRC
jgi:hypothetical protein